MGAHIDGTHKRVSVYETVTSIHNYNLQVLWPVFKGLHEVFWQVVRRAISLADAEISLYIDI